MIKVEFPAHNIIPRIKFFIKKSKSFNRNGRKDFICPPSPLKGEVPPLRDRGQNYLNKILYGKKFKILLKLKLELLQETEFLIY